MFPLPKLSAALAAFVMLLLVAFAPTAAFAHGGHKHAAPVETRLATTADATSLAGDRAVQELRSADMAGAPAQHDVDCGDRGCCGNGHCAGCVTALAPSGLAGLGPLSKSLRLTFDAVLPPSRGTSGPPRPPKSFV